MKLMDVMEGSLHLSSLAVGEQLVILLEYLTSSSGAATSSIYALMKKLPLRPPCPLVRAIEGIESILKPCCEHMNDIFTPEEHENVCREVKHIFKLHECPLLNRPVVTTASATAFKVGYSDANHGLLRALRYFEYCAVEGASAEVYAKSCAIVQSSGSGKSRLVAEIAKHIPTVYICHRDDSERGSYPLSTPLIRDFLLDTSGLDNPQRNGDLYVFSKAIALYCTAALVVHSFFKVKEADSPPSPGYLVDRIEAFYRLQSTRGFWEAFIEIMKGVTGDIYHTACELSPTSEDKPTRPFASWSP